MKYYIRRDLNEYGPYTLADLQRYVAQGNISLTDLTKSEAMTDWVPLSQVIGNIPAPATQPATAAYVVPQSATEYSGGSPYSNLSVAPNVYGGAHMAQGTLGRTQVHGLIPPDFHWALVLLISFFCGIFHIVWLLVEISFIRKLNRGDNSLLFLLSGIGVQIFGFVILVAVAVQGQSDTVGFTAFFWCLILGGAALQIISYFKMREALLDYYNTVEQINLRLSGVMTFFFAVYYFQYHFSRIAQWKRTGYLEPQQ